MSDWGGGVYKMTSLMSIMEGFLILQRSLSASWGRGGGGTISVIEKIQFIRNT